MTQITVTTGSLTPADLATDSLTSVTQTPVVTGSIIPADIATDRLTQTPVIKASNTPTQTDMSDTGSSSEDGGVSTAVFAGVGGMVVVIIALILLVILLIVILVRKNRNHKDNSIKNDRYVKCFNSCMRCPLLFVNKTSRILVHIDRWLTQSMALLWK